MTIFFLTLFCIWGLITAFMTLKSLYNAFSEMRISHVAKAYGWALAGVSGILIPFAFATGAVTSIAAFALLFAAVVLLAAGSLLILGGVAALILGFASTFLSNSLMDPFLWWLVGALGVIIGLAIFKLYFNF